MTFRSDILAGQRALVTGATQGIGAAVAAELAALGAHVLALGLPAEATALPDDGATALVPPPGAGDGNSHGSGGSVRIIFGNVASQSSMDQAFELIDDLDIVVNCAGVIRRNDEHQLEVFEQVLAINLTGTMRVCSMARPLLARRGGCIVNMASMLSFFGGSLVPAYASSKGGVAQLTKSLAIAYADDGIRVNAVAPGWIATPLTEALQHDTQRSQAILGRTPLKRWGTPADVAAAVAFLCTPAASFLTGVILPVDGGYLIS